MNIGTLRQRQSLPLECKIAKAIRTLEMAYRKYDGNLIICRGGADSAVVAWLAKQSKETENIPNVCVASVEPVENIKFNKEDGCILLKSEISKKKVIIDHGYPLISKEVSMALNRYLHTAKEEIKRYRLYGDRGDGKKYRAGVIPKKYREFIYAPYEFSEVCCTEMKKKPLKKYERNHVIKSHKGYTKDKIKCVPVTGEIAEESKNRLRIYLNNGCFVNGKDEKITPLGPWTKEDIKECIQRFNIPISDSYGTVIENDNKELVFSREQRTGCDICGFGIMFDLDRFDRLKKNKSGMYKQMMNGGQWIRKPLYRWVKFRPDSIPIWSNLYWVPSERGYGYRFVLNYFYKVLNINKKIEV